MTRRARRSSSSAQRRSSASGVCRSAGASGASRWTEPPSMGPQVHVGCVHHPGQAGNTAAACTTRPGALRPRGVCHGTSGTGPARARQLGQLLGNPASRTAHDHVRRERPGGCRAHSACRARRPARPGGSGAGRHPGSPASPCPPAGGPGGARGGPGEEAQPRAQRAGSLLLETRPTSAVGADGCSAGSSSAAEAASRVACGDPDRQAADPRRELLHPRGCPAPTRGSRTPGTRTAGPLSPRGPLRPAGPDGPRLR